MTSRALSLFFLSLLAVIIISIPCFGASTRPVTPISCASVTDAPSRRVYFFDPAGDERRLIALQNSLIERGAYHVNVFLPHHLVCMLPNTVSTAEITGHTGLEATEEHAIAARTVSSRNDQVDFLKQCYDLARGGVKSDAGIRRTMRETGSVPAIRDSLTIYDPSQIRRMMADPVPEDDPDIRYMFQDSEFMAGKIMLNLILPESGTWYENWRDSELTEAIKGALAGIIAYQVQFSTASIDYIVKTFPRAYTSYEPAHTRFEDHWYWIRDILKYFGYNYPNYGGPRVVHIFHNDLRRQYDADWITTVFIIRAQTIYNHQIVLTDFVGYSILGGPYSIIPYPAGPWGGWDPSYTMSLHMMHAFGHAFWALDEAESAKPRMCSVRSGYLNYINGYKVEQFILGGMPVNSCEGTIYPCIMEEPDWQWLSACDFTAGHIGLIDADENDVPDVFDTDPVVEFEGGPAETLVVDTLTVRCTIKSVPVPNRNSMQDPELWNHYASPLKDAVLDINGFGNLYLLAEDGRWDELEEELVIPLTDLSVGLTSVEIYVRNKAGRKSAALVKQVFRAGLSYSLYSARARNGGIELSWYMVGETFDATFNLYRIQKMAGRSDTLLIAENLQPAGELENQFLPFRYFDQDVEPTESYWYFIRGTYMLAIQGGEPQEFVSQSKTFKGTAVLAIPDGALLSHLIPNPFRTSTSFSVDIPITISSSSDQASAAGGAGRVGAAGIPWEVPTNLDVAVYDVTGRRIKTIRRDKVYGTILTLSWDGSNESGWPVPSGIYFIRVIAGERTQVRKVAVLR